MQVKVAGRLGTAGASSFRRRRALTVSERSAAAGEAGREREAVGPDRSPPRAGHRGPAAAGAPAWALARGAGDGARPGRGPDSGARPVADLEPAAVAFAGAAAEPGGGAADQDRPALRPARGLQGS